MSLLQHATTVYENIKNTHINIIRFENTNIQIFQKNISYLFSLLDRGVTIQNEISLRLWLLRSTVLNTLLPFNDERLFLQSQLNELQLLVDGFPEMTSSLEIIKKIVSNLSETVFNPKREWFIDSISKINLTSDLNQGILTNLSHGRSPGWSSEATSELILISDNVRPINSRYDLKQKLFSRVILPCGCINTPHRMLSELFYSGKTSQFEVLLYSGESFNVPKRLSLPVSKNISDRFENTNFEKVVTEINEHSSIEIIDEWINLTFWNEIHGGNRSGGESLIPAHYVLFKNGMGTFIPQEGRVQILYENSICSFSEGDLKSISVEDLHEGDLLILRVGQSGFLLDSATESIMQKTGVENLYEDATQWKISLEALLLTHTWEDVAIELEARGVKAPISSIQRWAGFGGIGPRNESDFNGLIRLLIEKGKINNSSETIEQYSKKIWNSLQSLRGLRQKAGNEVRQELFKALSRKLGEMNVPIGDKTSISIEADGSAELQILRVLLVDQDLSYVSSSRIGRVDDLRNNKWLG